jgi:uncharacterized protein involved in exopolysaccharide biosynthesis
MSSKVSDSAGDESASFRSESEITLLGVASVVIQWRRTILRLGSIGLVIGISFGLLKDRLYVASAKFLPQVSDGAQSGLAAAASQFGIRIPTTGATWTPALYVDLIRSPTLLEPIVRDTILVAEKASRRISVLDLLEIEDGPPTERTFLGVQALAKWVGVDEVRPISAVHVAVTSPWPTVSLALVERLVGEVNRFNLQTRKSQASAERQFVEARAAEAETTLRAAEERLQSFQQRNRIFSPQSQLGLEFDRLKQEVERYQAVYSSLLQNRDEARIREVRDTPVITMLETPRLPVKAESRGTFSKGFFGGLAGVALGVLIAFVTQAFIAMRVSHSEDAREFFRALSEAKFKRRMR